MVVEVGGGVSELAELWEAKDSDRSRSIDVTSRSIGVKSCRGPTMVRQTSNGVQEEVNKVVEAAEKLGVECDSGSRNMLVLSRSTNRQGCRGWEDVVWCWGEGK